MSASKVIDAIMRLTGAVDLEEGESVLITHVPGGERQVLRLRIRESGITHSAGSGGVLTLEAYILEGD